MLALQNKSTCCILAEIAIVLKDIECSEWAVDMKHMLCLEKRGLRNLIEE